MLASERENFHWKSNGHYNVSLTAIKQSGTSKKIESVSVIRPIDIQLGRGTVFTLESAEILLFHLLTQRNYKLDSFAL